MARKVVFRAAAERDLAKLYRDIRDQRGEPTVAINYIRRIRSYCEGFAEFPERGTLRDDIRPGLRIIGYERRVTIAFTFDDQARADRPRFLWRARLRGLARRG